MDTDAKIAVAAVVVASLTLIVSTILSIVSVVFSRRSAEASEKAAEASKNSAIAAAAGVDEAKRSADAALASVETATNALVLAQRTFDRADAPVFEVSRGPAEFQLGRFTVDILQKSGPQITLVASHSSIAMVYEEDDFVRVAFGGYGGTRRLMSPGDGHVVRVIAPPLVSYIRIGVELDCTESDEDGEAVRTWPTIYESIHWLAQPHELPGAADSASS